MDYLHKCDECGEVFKDDKMPMEHYVDSNGLMLCPKCDKKMKSEYKDENI